MQTFRSKFLGAAYAKPEGSSLSRDGSVGFNLASSVMLRLVSWVPGLGTCRGSVQLRSEDPGAVAPLVRVCGPGRPGVALDG